MVVDTKPCRFDSGPQSSDKEQWNGEKSVEDLDVGEYERNGRAEKCGLSVQCMARAFGDEFRRGYATLLEGEHMATHWVIMHAWAAITMYRVWDDGRKMVGQPRAG